MAVTEQTGIRTDRDTLTKLKVLAGEKSMGQYLRDIANGIETPPVPVNELEILRSSILKQLEEIKASIAEFDDAWFRSFMKHEKDVMFMANVQALMLKVQDKVNPGAWDYVMGEAERITKEDWQEHLDKNGLVECNDDEK
jgi:hypothetical protein